MTKLISAATALVASRVYGPFREAGGLPGETMRSRIDAGGRA